MYCVQWNSSTRPDTQDEDVVSREQVVNLLFRDGMSICIYDDMYFTQRDQALSIVTSGYLCHVCVPCMCAQLALCLMDVIGGYDCRDIC